MRIFGREPALWLAALQAIVAVVVGFQIDGFSPEQAALWMAAVNAAVGVAMALMTAPVAPSIFGNLFSVLATLGAAYGLDLGQEMVGLINAALMSVVVLLVRPQISPAEDAHKTGVLGNKVTTGP